MTKKQASKNVQDTAQDTAQDTVLDLSLFNNQHSGETMAQLVKRGFTLPRSQFGVVLTPSDDMTQWLELSGTTANEQFAVLEDDTLQYVSYGHYLLNKASVMGYTLRLTMVTRKPLQVYEHTALSAKTLAKTREQFSLTLTTDNRVLWGKMPTAKTPIAVDSLSETMPQSIARHFENMARQATLKGVWTVYNVLRKGEDYNKQLSVFNPLGELERCFKSLQSYLVTGNRDNIPSLPETEYHVSSNGVHTVVSLENGLPVGSKQAESEHWNKAFKFVLNSQA